MWDLKKTYAYLPIKNRDISWNKTLSGIMIFIVKKRVSCSSHKGCETICIYLYLCA